MNVLKGGHVKEGLRMRLVAAAGFLGLVAVVAVGCIGPSVPTPIACIQAEPTIGYAPMTVTFDASCSYVPEGAEGVYHFRWEFSDGSDDTGRAVVHTFTEPGTYTAEAIMINSEYDWVDTASRVVTVLPTPE